MTWTLVALPVALFLFGVPVFAVLLAAATVTLVVFTTLPPLTLHQVMFGGVDQYALLAVPFFIFAGELMGRSGIAERLVTWVLSLTGHVRGSLGIATVGTATLMGAISGSSPATVAAIGRTLYPSLLQSGYSTRFAAGLVTSSGSIAIVVPPSIAMILYGASAEQSIPRLFQAGLLPGLLIAGMMAGYIVIWANLRGVPRHAGFEFGRFVAASRQAWAALLMPAVILVGIYAGWFSPTEAGGVACLYAMLVGRFLYRSLGWRDILATAVESVYLTTQVLVIVAAAGVFSYLLTIQGVPQGLVAWIADLGLGQAEFLIAINVFLLLLGCFLDPTSAILVLTPILIPVIGHLGIDPVHFGIIMTVNLSIGMFTPPFGLNIFVAQSVMTRDVIAIWRGILPFLAIQIVSLAIITYVPALSLALPALL
ncbi:MAG: TRAP transporter large permease [Azospirillaceae bacterium]